MTIGKPLAQWLALSQAVLLNTGKTQSEIDPALLFPVAFGVCHCTHATTEQMEFASITWKCGADKRFLNYPCLSSRVGAAPSEGKTIKNTQLLSLILGLDPKAIKTKLSNCLSALCSLYS